MFARQMEGFKLHIRKEPCWNNISFSTHCVISFAPITPLPNHSLTVPNLLALLPSSILNKSCRSAFFSCISLIAFTLVFCGPHNGHSTLFTADSSLSPYDGVMLSQRWWKLCLQ